METKKNPGAAGRLKRKLLFIAGSVSAGIGVAGIFLPLLPTTPFMLLSAACYIRSSERFYSGLVNNKWLGAYIRNYREKTGIPLRAKAFSLAALWIAIGYSVYFVIESLPIRLLLVIIASAVSAHILSIRTAKGRGPAMKPG